MPDIPQALGTGVVFQIFLLVQDTVRLALKLIVTGKTLIKGCDFLSAHGLLPPFFENVKRREPIQENCSHR